ncbi:hypothetical protein AB0202_27230, partial [Klebsiella quasipneumoniae]|uniref:hypothetical protein n=1 Tax=Klebsiella quasipneumoniae TaxID=1463165 RepID=UPI00344BCCED
GKETKTGRAARNVVIRRTGFARLAATLGRAAATTTTTAPAAAAATRGWTTLAAGATAMAAAATPPAAAARTARLATAIADFGDKDGFIIIDVLG